MTTLFESLNALVHSDNRNKLIFSLLAVLCWLTGIALAVLSGSLPLKHVDFIIFSLMGFSAVFAIASVSRPGLNLPDKHFKKDIQKRSHH